MKILRKKKEDYTRVELDDFQDYIDLWFNDYVSLCGDAGCTNYTHLLAAGHILFYMERWGNLSNFSNQGWESLNAMIKTYFFRATNRGGGGGKGERTKTKLIAIGKWLQRRLMWLCYDIDELFPEGNNLEELGPLEEQYDSLFQQEEEEALNMTQLVTSDLNDIADM